ncbi:MAG TPA: ATP-binding cassette domain-containing protein, partial [Mycobacterium sp.]|nr:ATP-binding cassette domain-containing protein [Mycobacterium sp.]
MTVGALLSIRELVVEFRTRDGAVRAVDGLDLDVDPGETVAVVGESGAGKTVAMLAALGLLPAPPECTVRGQVLFDGRDLLTMGRKQLRQFCGRHIGMVFQDPMTSLHPSLRVVDQVAEALLVHHKGMATTKARDRAVHLLAQAGIPRPDRRVNDYPHQW